MKNIFTFFLLIHGGALLSSSFSDYFNWGLVASDSWSTCPATELEKLEKLTVENKDEELYLDTLKELALYKCAETIDEGLNRLSNLKGKFNNTDTESDLLLFSLFARTAPWAYFENADYEKANLLYGELSLKIINLHKSDKLSLFISSKVLYDLNDLLRIYDMDEDHFQAQELLEIFILNRINIDLSRSSLEALAYILLDTRISRINSILDKSDTEKLLSEMKIFKDIYLYGHNKKNFIYKEFYEYLKDIYSGYEDENYSNEEIKSLITSLDDSLSFEISFDESHLEALTGSISLMASLGVKEYDDLLERISSQLVFHKEKIEDVYSYFALLAFMSTSLDWDRWGKNNSLVCRNFRDLTLNVEKSSLKINDQFNMLSTNNLCGGNESEDDLKKQLLELLSEKKDDIQKNIQFMTNMTSQERYDEFLSFSYGDNLDLIKNAIISIGITNLINLTTNPDKYISNLEVVYQLIDFFPQKTDVKEIEIIQILNTLYRFVDMQTISKLPSRYLEQFRSLKLKYIDRVNQKFFFNIEALIAEMRSENEIFGYGANIKNFNQILSEYIELKFNLIFDDEDYFESTKGHYDVVFANLSENKLDRIYKFAKDHETLIVEGMERFYRESNKLRSGGILGVKEPILFNSEMLDGRDLYGWALYFSWLAERKLNEPAWINDGLENVFASFSWGLSKTKLTFAFFYNYLLNTSDEIGFKIALSEYYEKIGEFNRLKESLINSNSTKLGTSAIKNSALNLNQLLDETFEREEVLYKSLGNGDFTELLLPRIEVKDLKSKLDDNEAIISFISPSNGPVMVLYVDNEISDIFPSGYDRSTYENLFQEINKIISSNNNQGIDQFLLGEAQVMYIQFLKLAELLKKEKIYLVVDDLFAQIPFSILIDSNKKYAAESFSFIYLDSLISANLIVDTKPIKLDDQLNFVGIGDPLLNGDSTDVDFKNLFLTSRGESRNSKINQLKSLPETRDELMELSSLFKKSKLFLGNQATESNLLSTENKVILKDGDILSFATHAFTDKTNFSSEHGLVLTPPESLTFENDGLLTSKEISNLKLANSLVILSACDTDTPIFETAEEFSGLPRSFVESGAKSVLLTKWNIDSESAKIFMTETVKYGINNDLTLSESIKKISEKFINGDFGNEYRHPFYWAPYIQLGEY